MPNPPLTLRQRGWIWPENPPNLLTSTLAPSGPVQSPFYQLDWPNPAGPLYPQENKGFIRAANTQLIGQDTFFGAAGMAPVYHWPNPTSVRGQEPPLPPNLLVTTLIRPFFQTEWPNPQSPLFPQENKGWTRSANTQLIGQDKFFAAPGQAPIYDWPNPKGPRYPVQPEPPPNLTVTTLFVVPHAPFFQTEWPNPQQPHFPQENKGFVGQATVRFIGQDVFFGPAGLAPVYDYPLPQRPRYPLQPEPPPNLTIVYLPPSNPPTVIVYDTFNIQYTHNNTLDIPFTQINTRDIPYTQQSFIDIP